jgi:hypothetical protein
LRITVNYPVRLQRLVKFPSASPHKKNRDRVRLHDPAYRIPYGVNQDFKLCASNGQWRPQTPNDRASTPYQDRDRMKNREFFQPVSSSMGSWVTLDL